MLTPILIIALRLIKEITLNLKKPQGVTGAFDYFGPVVKNDDKENNYCQGRQKPKFFPDNGKIKSVRAAGR